MAFRNRDNDRRSDLEKVGASVGPGLRIWHFGGIFINPGVVLGSGYSLRQGVTIGNRVEGGGVPNIGNSVEIGAYAQVLGDIRIGDMQYWRIRSGAL